MASIKAPSSRVMSTTGRTAMPSVNQYPLLKGDMQSGSRCECSLASHKSIRHRYPQKVSGIKQRVRSAKFQEHFNQAQLFYNTLAPHERAHLIAALSFELSHCDDPVVYETYTNVLNNIDYDLSKIVARNVGGITPHSPARENPGKTSPALSQTYYFPKVPTIASRRIAILVADGFDQANVEGMQGAIRELGALPFLIGPRRGPYLPQGRKIGRHDGGSSL